MAVSAQNNTAGPILPTARILPQPAARILL
jgi:hypothetical protein